MPPQHDRGNGEADDGDDVEADDTDRPENAAVVDVSCRGRSLLGLRRAGAGVGNIGEVGTHEHARHAKRVVRGVHRHRFRARHCCRAYSEALACRCQMPSGAFV